MSSNTQKACPYFIDDYNDIDDTRYRCMCKYDDTPQMNIILAEKEKLFNNETDIPITTLLKCNMKEYKCNHNCNRCNFSLVSSIYKTLI